MEEKKLDEKRKKKKRSRKGNEEDWEDSSEEATGSTISELDSQKQQNPTTGTTSLQQLFIDIRLNDMKMREDEQKAVKEELKKKEQEQKSKQKDHDTETKLIEFKEKTPEEVNVTKSAEEVPSKEKKKHKKINLF